MSDQLWDAVYNAIHGVIEKKSTPPKAVFVDEDEFIIMDVPDSLGGARGTTPGTPKRVYLPKKKKKAIIDENGNLIILEGPASAFDGARGTTPGKPGREWMGKEFESRIRRIFTKYLPKKEQKSE